MSQQNIPKIETPALQIVPPVQIKAEIPALPKEASLEKPTLLAQAGQTASRVGKEITEKVQQLPSDVKNVATGITSYITDLSDTFSESASDFAKKLTTKESRTEQIIGNIILVVLLILFAICWIYLHIESVKAILSTTRPLSYQILVYIFVGFLIILDIVIIVACARYLMKYFSK